MTLHSIRAHLERRYDGPTGNAVSADHDASYMDQLVNRRELAWGEVVRVGKDLAAERRTFRETLSVVQLRNIKRLERDIAYALDIWRTYRDWTRPASAVRQAAE